MATTMKQLIDAAHAISTFNDGSKTATVEELVAVVNRYMKTLYSFAATKNKYAFATTATVAGAAGAWAKPTDAELVIQAALEDGTEVSILPVEDKEAELPPSIYLLGASYYPCGRASDPDPALDSIVFTYSARHTDLATEGLTRVQAEALLLDPSWPEQFNDLPVLHLARYMARKDGRYDEARVHGEEQTILMAQFQTHLESANAGMISRFSHDRIVQPGASVQK